MQQHGRVIQGRQRQQPGEKAHAHEGLHGRDLQGRIGGGKTPGQHGIQRGADHGQPLEEIAQHGRRGGLVHGRLQGEPDHPGHGQGKACPAAQADPFPQQAPGHHGGDERQQGDDHARLRGRGQAQGAGLQQKVAAGFGKGHEQEPAPLALAAQVAQQRAPQRQEQQRGHAHAPGHDRERIQRAERDAQGHIGRAPENHGQQQGQMRPDANPHDDISFSVAAGGAACPGLRASPQHAKAGAKGRAKGRPVRAHAAGAPPWRHRAALPPGPCADDAHTRLAPPYDRAYCRVPGCPCPLLFP